jgi:hypothetical protein
MNSQAAGMRAGETWIYEGPNPGRGEIHLVTSATIEGVTTWGTAYSWFGPADLFLQLFRWLPKAGKA